MPPQPDRRRPPDLVERLYVLWIITTLVLALMMVVAAVYGSGLLSRQTASVHELSRRLLTLEKELAARARAEPERRDTVSPTTDPRDTSAPRPENRRMATSQPGTTQAKSESTSAVGNAPRPPTAKSDIRNGANTSQPIVDRSPAPTGDPTIEQRLNQVLRPGAVAPFMLTDEQAGRKLLNDAMPLVERATWTGQTWVRLAVLAELLDDAALARRFSERAGEHDTAPTAFWHVAARRRLSRGDGPGARAFALRLLDVTPRSASAQLLAAEALMAGPETAPVEAHEILDLLEAGRLTAVEQILLGRLASRLERWELLNALVAEWDDRTGIADRSPGPLRAERDLLRAIAAIHAGRAVEGLAVLDHLRETGLEGYEANLWRGIALVEMRSFDAAEQALEALTREASRPEGWYWRGIVALRRGRTEEAPAFFQTALTADSRHAPAWEALAALALERQEVSKAVEYLDQAVRAGPRRATAYFMLALAYAKLSNRETAAATLRTAIALDESMLATAKATDVLARLFSEAELAALAGAGGATSAPSSAPSGG